MIALTDIRKRFGTLDVLRGVSLEVARGEVVAVVGASGAGKSTLLQIAGTLMRPDGGRVVIDGTDVGALGDRALSRFRNERIGFVFQFHHLLPEFTALENVMIPALIGRRDKQAAGLDSDPYVQAQDCGPETLARLRVECDSADCSRCRVFLWDGWRRACREVVVRAVCGAQGYRIAAIEDPNLPGGVSGADATRAGEACGR